MSISDLTPEQIEEHQQSLDRLQKQRAALIDYMQTELGIISISITEASKLSSASLINKQLLCESLSRAQVKIAKLAAIVSKLSDTPKIISLSAASAAASEAQLPLLPEVEISSQPEGRQELARAVQEIKDNIPNLENLRAASKLLGVFQKYFSPGIHASFTGVFNTTDPEFPAFNVPYFNLKNATSGLYIKPDKSETLVVQTPEYIVSITDTHKILTSNQELVIYDRTSRTYNTYRSSKRDPYAPPAEFTRKVTQSVQAYLQGIFDKSQPAQQVQ